MKYININITYYNPEASVLKQEISVVALITYKKYFWSKPETREAILFANHIYFRWKDTGEGITDNKVRDKFLAHKASL
jgi:hypothetical protein